MNLTRELSDEEKDSYSYVSRDLLDRVRIIETKVRIPGFYGVTFGRYIIVGKNTDCSGNNNLVAHELVHVRQWYELGTVGFLSTYLTSFGKNLIKHKNWNEAYREIGLEIEARKLCEAWKCDE